MFARRHRPYWWRLVSHGRPGMAGMEGVPATKGGWELPRRRYTWKTKLLISLNYVLFCVDRIYIRAHAHMCIYICSIYDIWEVRLETSDLLLSCPTFWLGCRYKQHTELHIVYRTLTLWATSICSTLLVHHFIISGWKGVKDTLAGLAQQHGVEIKTNVAVEEVIVSGGRAVGVKLQGGVE